MKSYGTDLRAQTYNYQLNPTPAQEQALELVLSRCRTLYNVALEQRKTWWGRGQGLGATYYQQQNELPELKAACPEYGGCTPRYFKMCCTGWIRRFRRSSGA